MDRQLAYLPSPTSSVLHLGPLPIHYYALCIVAGILTAVFVTDRRWRARGGGENEVGDVAGWAVIFGILGGRLYHVITDPELYFDSGRHPIDAFKIWDGGLGIWGAVALGGLGAWIGCRRHGMNFAAFADAIAPALLLAQAVGRVGNWFNNELYGRATTVAWKLQIHDLDVVNGKAAKDPQGHVVVLGYFQPTFLYELLWNVAVAAVLLFLDRRYRLGRGNVFALYVAGYTAGRFWIELLRSDHANHILGIRVNNWVAAVLFVAAVAWFVTHRQTPRSSAQRKSADLPGGAMPGEAMPGEAMPGEAMPGEAMPGEAMPGEAMSSNAVSSEVGAGESDPAVSPEVP